MARSGRGLAAVIALASVARREGVAQAFGADSRWSRWPRPSFEGEHVTWPGCSPLARVRIFGALGGHEVDFVSTGANDNLHPAQ